jgi:hypothetical protein
MTNKNKGFAFICVFYQKKNISSLNNVLCPSLGNIANSNIPAVLPVRKAKSAVCPFLYFPPVSMSASGECTLLVRPALTYTYALSKRMIMM